MHAWGILHPAAITAMARESDRRITTSGLPSEKVLAGNLSGGNQQKLVLARELGRDPELLVAAQPTRGLDVGAIEFVHRQILAARDAGKAVLLVSLELEEVLSLVRPYPGHLRGARSSGSSQPARRLPSLSAST